MGGPREREVPTGMSVYEAIVEGNRRAVRVRRCSFRSCAAGADQGRVLSGDHRYARAGRAPSVKVLQSPNPGFDQIAKSYVLKALFRPRGAWPGGRVLIQIPIDFRLKQ